MRLYRLLLHLFPASFRNEYGHEMAAVVARRLKHAGPIGRIGVWLDVVADLAMSAARVQMEVTARDVGYALRSALRAPMFAITVVLVSAVGIGATTAAFTITDHVLVRPLPFNQPHRLVRLYHAERSRGHRLELSPPNFRDWQRMATSFRGMGAFTLASANLVDRGEPERLIGARLTADVLPILGVRPLLGRVFTPEEDRDGAPGTVVFSHALWRERFGSDPNVIGRTVVLNDLPFQIIGVMPPGFSFPQREAQFWTAMRFRPQDFEDRANWYLYGIARLREGVSVDDAQAEMSLIAAQLERQFPAENKHKGAAVADLRVDLSRQSRLLLIALSGAALCVLLIACTNVGNLLLARSLARRRELAVRTALGAGRDQIVRQLLTESALLTAAGAILGLALAYVVAPLMVRLVPNALPIAQVPPLDGRMLLLALVSAVATGIGFGVLPALRAGRVDTAALAEGTRTGPGHHTERLRSFLVVAEVTASVVLLISAGLLIRALWQVQQVKPGFEATDVLLVRTRLPLPKYAATNVRAQFYERVLGDVAQLPQVTSAAYTTSVPLGTMRGGIWPITMDGRRENEADAPTASLRYVTPGYFSTLRIPFLAGRDVDMRDTVDSPFVAVVSESFTRQHFPGQPPLGRRFFMAFRERIIVGVVGDVRFRGLERLSEPQVYLPYRQVPDGGIIGYIPTDLVVRSTAPLPVLIPAVREVIARADPRQPVSDPQSLQTLVDAETAPRSTQLRVLGAFAGIALLLAGIGLHGLLAFTVSSRIREIGVRIALGAGSRDIVGLVVRHGLGLAVIGTVVGVALAYAAGRSMQSLLFGVSPTDALAYGAAVGLVLAVALAGTLAPALRAMRVDPLTAIRTE
jgi:predicted permease